MSTAEQLSEQPSFLGKEDFDFLAPERRQKFDLLVHLLANLDQPLFLSGPDGIGKTTLLQQLQCRALPGWQITLIEASGDQGFETLQHSLAISLGLEIFNAAGLSECLDAMARREEIMVLAVDDAGLLMPGVLDALCRFALHFPALRVVAALRPDDIHVKGMSDSWAVEEAHIIELPPLTEAQSQAYLQNVWIRLGKTLDPESREAGDIYKISHGVPANIRHYALGQIGKPSVQWHRALAKPVYLALAAVVLAVVGVTWWQQQVAVEPRSTASSTQPSPSRSVAQQATSLVQTDLSELPSTEEPALPFVTGSETVTPLSDEFIDPLESVVQGNGAAQDEIVVSELGQAGDKAVSELKQTSVTPAGDFVPAKQKQEDVQGEAAPVSEPPSPTNKAIATGEAGLYDAAWLMQQPPLHYTLQIAAFDKLEDLRVFARRHNQLQPLAFYQKRRNGRDWYPLLYGVYASLEASKQARNRLPAGIEKPWLRRLRSVQKEIHANSSP